MEFLKIPKTFPNKGSKHRKNHMEGLNSKNKNENITGGGSPLMDYLIVYSCF